MGVMRVRSVVSKMKSKEFLLIAGLIAILIGFYFWHIEDDFTLRNSLMTVNVPSQVDWVKRNLTIKRSENLQYEWRIFFNSRDEVVIFEVIEKLNGMPINHQWNESSDIPERWEILSSGAFTKIKYEMKPEDHGKGTLSLGYTLEPGDPTGLYSVEIWRNSSRVEVFNFNIVE